MIFFQIWRKVLIFKYFFTFILILPQKEKKKKTGCDFLILLIRIKLLFCDINLSRMNRSYFISFNNILCFSYVDPNLLLLNLFLHYKGLLLCSPVPRPQRRSPEPRSPLNLTEPLCSHCQKPPCSSPTGFLTPN